jgi:type IV secretion system protein VirB10
VGIGAGAGAAAGIIGVLMAHGSNAMLTKGSTVEMVLDRPLTFDETDLDFRNAPPRGSSNDGGTHGPAQQQRRGWLPGTPW